MGSKLAGLLGHPCPPMPGNALPWEVRAVLGRSGALKLWEQLWNEGVTLGIGIGAGGTLIAVSFVALAALLVVALVSRSRGAR